MGSFASSHANPLQALRRAWERRSRRALNSQRLLDLVLLAVLIITPLALGGRKDHGRLVYVALAVSAGAAAAFSRRSGDGSLPAAPLALFAAGAAVLAVQLTPMPPSLLGVVAPSHAATLPLWTDGPGGFGEWSVVSLAPHRTLRDLALWIAHASLFYAVCVRVRTFDDLRGVLTKLGVAVGIAGLVGVASLAISNGKLLGIYDYPAAEFGEHLQGTFTNRNHFGGFLLLGVWSLPLIAVTAAKRPTRIVASAAAVIVSVLILATLSRGAAAAFGGSVLGAAAIWWCSGHTRRGHAIGGAVVVLAVIGGLSMFGYDQIARRLDDLVSVDVERLDRIAGRRAIWQANLDAFAASPLLGHGAGSHRDAHKRFLETPFATEFTHAESSLLQVASETGLAGVAVLAGGVLLTAITVLRSLGACRAPIETATLIAIAAPLAGSGAHAAIDFVWHAPAIFALVAMLAALAFRTRGALEESSSAAIATEPGWAPRALITAAGAFAVLTLVGPALGALHWDRYLRHSRTVRDLTAQLVKPSEHPADRHLPGMIRQATGRAVAELQRVVAADPGNARAWSRLASRMGQQYEQGANAQANPMPCMSLREAALASDFPGRAATREWRERAVGDSAHLILERHDAALRAVNASPLMGEAYLSLAATSMLFATPRVAVEPLVDQALAVLPNDGRVHFEAGRQFQSLGDVEKTLALWRRAAERPGSHRVPLVTLVATALPAADFVRALQPSSDLLLRALPIYESRGDATEVALLAKQAFANATASQDASSM